MNMSGVNGLSRALHLAGLVLLDHRSPPGNVDETAVSIVELLHSNGMGMLVRHNLTTSPRNQLRRGCGARGLPTLWGRW
jgi:hypothetical protein